MQQIITNVNCSICHQAFRLSPSDSTVFLQDLQIEVECPVCNKIVNLSVIPKFKNKNANAPKEKNPASSSRVGLPSFKPLVDFQKPTQIHKDPLAPKVPFDLITKKEKPSSPKTVTIKPIIAACIVIFLSCIGMGVWFANQSSKKVVVQQSVKKEVQTYSESHLYPDSGMLNKR